MARNRSLPDVLQAIVAGIAQCRNVVLARIWLKGPGDICARCHLREECPDQTECLHLVASAGNTVDGTAVTGKERLDGAFSRFPLGTRKIGRVGRTGEPLLLSGLKGTESWIAAPGWFREQRARTFAAQPLIFRDQILGVLALFDRKDLSVSDFEWLQVFADHAAVSIANARAFEEIEQLKARLEAENQYLRQEMTEVIGQGQLVGSSPGLRKLQDQIRLVAPTDASVLITGESGTGKELVARAIHEASPRKSHPLIRVNCSAVPESLFESEFFGHVRGAFTGALKDKPGRFELASGGTLFLDEIGEVPLPLQSKLLRAIQEQEIERVGDTKTRKVDVRILAATNRDLKHAIESGTFRTDLFYRLSVFPIEIPPLRERPQDIVPLALHFLRTAAARMNRPAPVISESALRRLESLPWHGNVRELQNAMERAVILAEGGPVEPHLPLSPSRPPTPAAASNNAPRAVLTREELRRQERESIEAALQQTSGKVSGPGGAAELLGMKPTTLTSRIKALGLQSAPRR